MTQARLPLDRDIGERPWLVLLIVLAAVALACIMLLLPLAVVLHEAAAAGAAFYRDAVTDPDAVDAIQLTLTVAAIAVPLNTAFGLAAAWCVTQYRFRGRQLIVTLAAVPFSVSPVIAGLIYVLIFGLQGWLGPTLAAHGIRIIFTLPGVVLATVFVTLPFVARQLIPLMEALGNDEELAALTLGATGWQIFRQVTLPKIRWGLLYGVLLCNARAIGEFGAVSVVSGHIRGATVTMPLEIEILYNDYNLPAAFAVASLLAGMALVTLGAKAALEWWERHA